MRRLGERGSVSEPGPSQEPIEAAPAEPHDRGRVQRRQAFNLVGNERGTFLWREGGKCQANPLVDADGLELGGAPRRGGPRDTMIGPMRSKHALAQPRGRALGVAQLGEARQSRIDGVRGQDGGPLPVAELEDEGEPVEPRGVQLAEGGAFLSEPRVGGGVGCGLVQDAPRLRHGV